MKKYVFFIGLLVMLFGCLPRNYAFASESIPQQLLDNANEYNFGHDNYVIFIDDSGYYYVPRQYSYQEASHYTGSWRYVYYDGIYGLVTPYWAAYDIMVYNPDGSPRWGTSLSGGTNAVIPFEQNNLRIVYASKDVLYGEGTGSLEGTVFFQLPPTQTQRLTELAEVVMVSTEEKSPIIQVVYLMPLVISLVISFLGLRKCLKVLQTILSGA